ncbi:MAG: redoxin family protein [Rubripirellula sp.]
MTEKKPASNALRLSIGLLVLAVNPTITRVASAAPPTATEALSLSPVQADIAYDLVPDQEQSNCTVRDLQVDLWSGWEVLSPDGLTLRVFVDTNGDKKVDLWCYYSQGTEIYRDIDANFNGKADQYRWLGTNGTRWGIDPDEDGYIDRWKTISAEEVSEEAIRAIQKQDQRRFLRLLASESDLLKAGLGTDLTQAILEQISTAKDQFAGFSAGQGQLTGTSQWLQFAAQRPGTIAKGIGGATLDYTLYDNAVALFSTSTQNDLKTGQLFLGSLLKIEDRWCLLGLPSFDQQQALLASGMPLNPWQSTDMSMQNASISEATQGIITELEKIDRQISNMPFEPNSQNEQLTKLNQRRADLLEKMFDATENDVDKETWARQLSDMLAIGAQTGTYPGAVERLALFTKKLESDRLPGEAYANYQNITTIFLVNQLTQDDFTNVLNQYVQKLEEFTRRYPQSEQASQALNQLAIQKEFNNEQEQAAELYRRIANQYPESTEAEIASGALKRIESIGKRIDLRGRTINGMSFQLSSLRGNLIVLHYWATWCSPCLQDIKALQQIEARYRNRNVKIVGVNVDVSADKTKQFLIENPLSWPQLFEEGGLEGSGLSKALGIQTLPAMLLIDEDGKVISNNLQIDQLRSELTRLAR